MPTAVPAGLKAATACGAGRTPIFIEHANCGNGKSALATSTVRYANTQISEAEVRAQYEPEFEKSEANWVNIPDKRHPAPAEIFKPSLAAPAVLENLR